MKRTLSAIGAFVLGSGLVGACSASSIPAGQTLDASAGDGSSSSGSSSGGSSGGSSSGSSSGSSGSSSGGVADAGACCPTGYSLYACTFPDGGSGQACHNPALGCASSLTCGEGCDPVVTGRCGGQADACPGLGCDPQCPNGVLKDANGCDTCQCAPPADGGSLQWYTTCAYQVCGADDGGVNDAGPACPAAGSPCSQVGQMCGTPSNANCGVTLVCASQDPKAIGCPVSSRKYKDGIEYVDDSRLKELHDEALGIRLATYRYKPEVADPDVTHLGFIVEDDLRSPAVDMTHNGVDMYGYLSMVVAGMQVQEKEIAQLRSELERTRIDLAACKSPRK